METNKKLLNPQAHAQAILENAAQRGGDLDILAGVSIYVDIRFGATDAEMREWIIAHGEVAA